MPSEASKVILSWTEWMGKFNKSLTVMNCQELQNEYVDWLLNKVNDMGALLEQLKSKAYDKREEFLKNIIEPRDVITNRPDSDLNIINNRVALIFDSIKTIEENLQYLETRYGKSDLP